MYHKSSWYRHRDIERALDDPYPYALKKRRKDNTHISAIIDTAAPPSDTWPPSSGDSTASDTESMASESTSSHSESSAFRSASTVSEDDEMASTSDGELDNRSGGMDIDAHEEDVHLEDIPEVCILDFHRVC